MEDKLKSLEAKKQKIDDFKPFSPDLLKNLDEWFNIELTYTSNAIEGNTLTRQETALVIEKGLTVKGKTLKEHLEAVSHVRALNYIKTLIGKKQSSIGQDEIKQIHHLILRGIDDRNAGTYRNIAVRIAGSRVIMPNPLKISQLMDEFIIWLHNTKEHPVKIAADAHLKLVSIHPFTDGNGRTARLLMNLILMQNGYPPAIIKKEDRLEYINSIEKAQLGDDPGDYYKVIYKTVNYSLDIYLKALLQKEDVDAGKGKRYKLLKISELANLADESVPTIRYWTKEGLLKVDEITEGGYQLYSPETVKTVKKIRQLQKTKRLTVKEIKNLLDGMS
ncbi:MAG: Fic family protein [Armatimonadota bacterium]